MLKDIDQLCSMPILLVNREDGERSIVVDLRGADIEAYTRWKSWLIIGS